MKEKNKCMLRMLIAMMCLLLLAVVQAPAQSSEPPTLKIKEKKGKYGVYLKDLINLGKIIPYEYDTIIPLKTNNQKGDYLFLLERDNKFGIVHGVIHTHGKDLPTADANEILACEYDSIYPDTIRNLYSVKKNGKVGLVTFKTNYNYDKATDYVMWLLPCSYEEAAVLFNYSTDTKTIITYKVGNGGKYGVANYVGDRFSDGNSFMECLPCQYEDVAVDSVLSSSTQYIKMKENGKYGYAILDYYSDKPLATLPCEYDKIEPLTTNGVISSALAIILEKNGKEGLASKKDLSVMLPCEYDRFPTYYNDDLRGRILLEAVNGDNMGILDLSSQKMLIPIGNYKSGSGSLLSDRINLTKTDGTTTSFDMNGKPLAGVAWAQMKDAWRDLNSRTREFFYVSKKADGPYTAIVNKNDKVIVNLTNTTVLKYWSNHNVFFIKRNGKVGVISAITGNLIVPCSYNGFWGDKNTKPINLSDDIMEMEVKSDRIVMYNNTTTGKTFSVFYTNGKLIVRKTFRNSDRIGFKHFMQDYM